jgi:hypothetical protein
MADRERLQTPWLREQLIEELLKLSDPVWLARVVDTSGRTKAEMDAVLDFLDDTGVVDDPSGRVGHILVDDAEARVLERLGAAVGRASGPPSSETWKAVVLAAGEALRYVTERDSLRPDSRT